MPEENLATSPEKGWKNLLIGDRDGSPAPPLALSTEVPLSDGNATKPHAPQNPSLADAEGPPPAPESARQRDPVLPAPQRPWNSWPENAVVDVTLPGIREQTHMHAKSTKSDNIGNKYEYFKLDHGDIRLLHLLPNEEKRAPIRCQLFHYPLRKTEERACLYEALSYTWGGEHKPDSISIGERCLPVTKNLHAALICLRDRFIGRVIWVDAICIDQEDYDERGQQVRFMTEIYCKASRVLVWLGEAGAHDHQALKAIHSAAGDEPTGFSNEGTIHIAILELLGRPWFRRIWVLQEVAAARQVRIVCGSTDIDGYAFCLGLLAWERSYPGVQDRIRPVAYLIMRSIFRPEYTADPSGGVSLGICPLGELMDMYLAHEATDPRDKVFALLGMGSDDPSAVDAAGLSPNYHIPFGSLLERLVRFLLGGQVSVNTGPDPKMAVAVIESKGCVLGKVSSVDADNQQVDIDLKDISGYWRPPKKWTLQMSPKSVEVGDLVCLLHGASKPTIIRPHTSHFSVIRISVSQPEQTVSYFPYNFRLVWDWESRGGKHPDEEVDYLDKAVRLLNTAAILKDAAILRDGEKQEEAEGRFQKIKEDDRDGFSKVYGQMMTGIEKGPTRDPEYCKNVLVATCLAYRPLSLCELAVVAGLPPDVNPMTIVAECGSFLTVSENTVNLIHRSAKDYLTENWLQPIRVAQGHTDISRRSLAAISKLEQNIYNLDFGFKPKGVTPPEAGPFAPIQYSCVFWVDHLLNGESHECQRELMDGGAAFGFLKELFLRWLESLSLLGKLSDRVPSIRKLQQVVQTSGANPWLAGFLEDAEKFIRNYGSIIERAPLQTYGSALVFSPTGSKVKDAQWKERLPFIKTVAGIRRHWDAHQQTLEGHSNYVSAVAFSPDGETLASASGDHTIRLWHVATGTHRQTLQGHRGDVNAIAFSPDGKTLASASRDGRVRFWDTATGVCQQTFKEQSDAVSGIAFSPDGKTLALALRNHIVQLWDTATGAAQQTLKGHSDAVYTVAFSPDGKTLASASCDHTVRLWDAATSAYQQTLKGHSETVYVATFSPDGKTLASASGDRTVRLWDAATGAHQQTLEGHSNVVNGVAFSLDGKTLASASDDGTVRLWDAATGAHQQTLKGHNDEVYTVAFSPDSKTLASASGDHTVRLWNIAIGAIGAHQQALEEHSDWIHAVAFSPDGKTLVSASRDKSVRLWDPATGAHRQTLKTNQDCTNLVFSENGQHLKMDDGSLIRLTPTSVSLDQHPDKKPLDHPLHVDNEWITLDREKLLWLPNDYRATSVALRGSMVVLGHRSGGLTFLQFEDNSMSMDDYTEHAFANRESPVPVIPFGYRSSQTRADNQNRPDGGAPGKFGRLFKKNP